MIKNIKTKLRLIVTLLTISLFANAQQAEPLPVMASKTTDAISTQTKEVKKEVIKPEKTAAATPWLLSRTQNISPLVATPANVLVNNNNGATAIGNFTQSETSILAYGNNVITALDRKSVV